MPIVKITDREGMFTEIGRIHKGAEKSQNAPGANLDHFRVTFRSDESEAQNVFFAVYGEQPRRINVRFPYPDRGRVWDAYYEAYVKGGMIAQATGDVADGGRWKYFYNYETGEVCIRDYIARNDEGRALIATGPHLDQPVAYVGGKNNPVLLDMQGRLKVVVPETGRAAHLTLLTGSIHDIISISEELQAYADQAAIYGKTIMDIPFVLVKRLEKITKKINGKKVKVDDWMCHILPSQEWTTKFQLMIDQKMLDDIVEGEVRDIRLPPPASEYDEYDKVVARLNPPVESGSASTPPIPEESEPPAPETPNKPSPSAGQETESHDGRPYPPETFKAKFTTAVEVVTQRHGGKEDFSIDVKSRQALASALDKVFGNKLKRYEFCDWLMGVSSTADMTSAQVVSLSGIMGIKNFDSAIDKTAKQEIEACHAYIVSPK